MQRACLFLNASGELEAFASDPALNIPEDTEVAFSGRMHLAALKARRWLWIFGIVMMACTVMACGTTASSIRRPPIKFAGGTIAKSVVPEGDLGQPAQPADKFYISDEQVVSHVRFENFAGVYRLRWDWYSPSGQLYTSSGDYTVSTTEAKYRRVLTAWHTMQLKGDKAETMPGKWSVQFLMNDDLVDTQTFMLSSTAQLSLPEQISQKADPHNWGLVVGIENYANLPDAEFARKDALVVKEYFIRALGVPEQNIILLLDSDATKARMESYIRQYLPKNLHAHNQLYVYFAGHGAPEISKGDAYLVPYDGDTRFLESSGYPLKTFYADLDKIGNLRTYIFLDACFSGIASRAAEMLAKGTRPALLHVEDTAISPASAGHMLSISSSSASEPSNAYPDTGHGLFTYFLLKGIAGNADANSDGLLNVDEVYQYVSTHVSQQSRRMGSQQMPMITPNITTIKDITIGRVPR